LIATLFYERREVTDRSPTVFTVGHSNHEEQQFLQLLAQHSIDVLADVRSHPYSRYSPQFNRESLQQALNGINVRYLFLGDQLGGRPADESFYDEEGHVLYWRVAESPVFREGIERVERGRQQYRIALMCSEEDPAVCHRYLLVTRVLAEHGVDVQHIRGDGTVQSQKDVEQQAGGRQGMLFAELEQDTWRSLRSVSPKVPPNTSSDD
jgi:uncharacterized protein (DUF488 family)